jgi:hypothetical protein
LFAFILEFTLFSQTLPKKITKLQKFATKKMLVGGGRGLIHLYNAKFSPILKKNSIKEMKVKYIHTSLKIIILQICCDIYFKVM